ncbi:MAG: hypothetical protein VW942_06075 [Aquiluna sp.]|jgi:hypothetical protein
MISPALNNLWRPDALVEAHPHIFSTKNQLNEWLRHKAVNGLEDSGAVVRRGRLIFIDTERFACWLRGETP